MTSVFHLYSNQELYQSTEHIHRQLTELTAIFPDSQFLKTQRALLFYHSKGKKPTLRMIHFSIHVLLTAIRFRRGGVRFLDDFTR